MHGNPKGVLNGAESISASWITVDAQDNLAAFDRMESHFSILRPGSRARIIPAPIGVFSAAWTNEGDLVVNASVPDAARAGVPFHIFSSDGRYKDSFGVVEPLFPSQRTNLMRWVTRASDGGFWAVPFFGKYRIERWSSSGSLVRTLDRKTPWFYAGTPPRRTFSKLHHPDPRIVSIVESEGLLWVLALVEDDAWREGLTWGRLGYFEAAEGVFACGFCVDCATNSGAGHAFMTGSGSTAIREGDMHACIATDCVSSVHPTCGGSQQDDDASGEASDIDLYAGRIAQGDSRALSELFRAFPSRVRVNLAREAVQVVSDCSDDAILVHVPLNAEQLKVAQRIAFGLATE